MRKANRRDRLRTVRVHGPWWNRWALGVDFDWLGVSLYVGPWDVQFDWRYLGKRWRQIEARERALDAEREREGVIAGAPGD
ncbi:MAG TPA: hypothetical protein VGW74_14730 [Propionibacteriaceae bacterium]|nr:hypothetical protein [Propionibacteriaceae bacterium]